jgi:glycosyltransferase involved in cell wall biosynthesis
MKLSVNILTWNTWDILHKTLHVLANELQGLDYEVIIVDNGSIDGCQDVATIKNSENKGISVGKNQGIRASKGDFILLLDGDIMPVPNSIRCLLNYMEEHPEIEALGFHANKWINQENKNGQVHHETYCKEIVQVEENTAHCCYYGMYRKSVFDKGAMFDENYGAGYGFEDLDFFNEMKARGIKQYHCHINSPAGRYYHKINSSIRIMGHETYMRTCGERAKYFKEKWKLQNA